MACQGHTGKCNPRTEPHKECGTKHCTMGACPKGAKGSREASEDDPRVPGNN